MNHTMNVQGTWFKTFPWPFEHHGLSDVNILMHSDGGARRDRCSASAWIVEVGTLSDHGWTFKPLAMSGTYFSVPLSSFTVETLALEECAMFVKRLLEKGIEQEPLGSFR